MRLCIIAISGQLARYMPGPALARGHQLQGACRLALFGPVAQLLRFADLGDQLEACRASQSSQPELCRPTVA